MVPAPANAQSSAAEVAEPAEVEASSGAAEPDELRRSGAGREGDSTGIRIGAGLASLLYTPTKVAYAGLGVVVGGLGWVFSGGEGQVALDIMQPSFRGDYLIRPAHLRGTESIRFVGRKSVSEPAAAMQRAPRPGETSQASSGEPAEPNASPGSSPDGDLADRGLAADALADEHAVAGQAVAENETESETENETESERGDPVVGDDTAPLLAGSVAPVTPTRPSASDGPPSSSGRSGDSETHSASGTVADSRSGGEQSRSIRSSRDGSKRSGEEVDSAARSSGRPTQGLPAVSSPPPPRKVEETTEPDRARRTEEARPTSASASASADRPAPGKTEVERARWEETQQEAPDRARDGSSPEPAGGEGAERAWPEPQVDSLRWKKNASGVWVYEAP